jgi:FtsZ-binding cell division protein ZapB
MTQGQSSKQAAMRANPSRRSSPGIVHPVIIYPFRQPKDFSGLEELYKMVARLDADKTNYGRPVTVMDRKTCETVARDKKFAAFRKNVIARHSDILEEWCADTCQMWYCGLGHAFDNGGPNDVYWLIPGDFNYGTPVGHEVLGHLHDLPEICVELQQDLCIGEIATDHNNSKQLIDTYGTFALLYNWFPNEASEIREYTERPRSEFFAIRHGFLDEMLHRRWFAYEQTVVMLLRAVATHRRISRFFVGNITDLPEGRESVASAMQQVERAERVLKTVWRELNESKPGWTERYHVLEGRSENIRRSAMVILENLLK